LAKQLIRDSLTDYKISDSVWLDQGSLAVAAGAQLFVFDKNLKNLDIRGKLHLDAHNYPLDNIFDVCLRLNGPLPVYHPQFLQQAILAGKSLACIFLTIYREASTSQQSPEET